MKYHRENYDIDKICPLWADYQVVQLIKPNSTILEIGCATGYIGKFLKEKRNCKMYAVEIDKESAELAKPYYEKIIVGDVENDYTIKQIPDIRFDYILCMNVLEHLK
ncbi:MAG: class I SAM-dependent methyltransferase, partial [Candidatus Aenigmatarchaeota archaeon]